ncbi:MAG: PAS domain S-box protein [Pseudomonadota bacterium]|nr:PAS domain S-box protein [Pseudomonadota bacterium]
MISRDGEIATWNAGAEVMFGYTREEIIGKPLGTLFTNEDREHDIPANELETARRKGRAMDYRWHRRKDESCFWADGVMSPIRGSDGGLAGFVKILRDATDKYEHEQEIMRLARVDPLTGLANRAEFIERFKAMTASAERHGQLLIVQLIDLDHFKQVLFIAQLPQRAADRLHQAGPVGSCATLWTAPRTAASPPPSSAWPTASGWASWPKESRQPSSWISAARTAST